MNHKPILTKSNHLTLEDLKMVKVNFKKPGWTPQPEPRPARTLEIAPVPRRTFQLQIKDNERGVCYRGNPLVAFIKYLFGIGGSVNELTIREKHTLYYTRGKGK